MGIDNWTLMHIGMSVKNMEETVTYLKSLGAKTGDYPSFVLNSGKGVNLLRTYGKTGAPPWKIRVSMLQLGPLTLEVAEPIDGGNYNEIYLKEHGEGANHIAYLVDNIEDEIKEMASKGIAVMYHLEGIWAYLDTTATGGLVIEFFQRGVDIRKIIAAMQ